MGHPEYRKFILVFKYLIVKITQHVNYVNFIFVFLVFTLNSNSSCARPTVVCL